MPLEQPLIASDWQATGLANELIVKNCSPNRGRVIRSGRFTGRITIRAATARIPLVGWERGAKSGYSSRDASRLGMRVLIVDDELQMAEALQRGLEREGYSTLLAHDGEKALDLARTVDHDLTVLDWMLPKVDGSEVAGRLREAGIAILAVLQAVLAIIQVRAHRRSTSLDPDGCWP